MNPVVPVDKSFPFGDSRTLDSVVASGSDPALAFFGIGGGIHALDLSDPLGPKVYQPGGSNPLRLRTTGFVYRVRSLSDRLYTAAGTAGFVRFDRTDTNWPIDVSMPGLSDARAIAAVRIGTDVRVLVGSVNDDESDGTLYLIDPTTQTVLASVASVGAAIWSLEAWWDTTNARIVVLVGTACLGVRRYHVTGATYNAISGLIASWGDTGAVTDKRFVRDIKIDSTNVRAFVAAFQDGVYALDISGTGLVPIAGSWPIRPTKPDMSTPLTYVNSLALDAANSRLVIGFGSALFGEEQVSGACNRPLPCNCTRGLVTCDVGEQWSGIQAWNIATITNPGPEKSFTNPEDDLFLAGPLAIALRNPTASSYLLDISTNTGGYRSLRGFKVGDAWFFQSLPPYDEKSGLTLYGWDVLAIQDGALYSSTELGIATFDLQAPALLDNYTSYVFQAPKEQTFVGLTTLPAPDARMFCSADDLIRFFDIDGANKLQPKLSPFGLKNPGDLPGQKSFTQFCTAFLGFALPAPLTNRWLAVPYYRDFDAIRIAERRTGGVHVYHVGTAKDGNEPQVFTLAKYLHTDLPGARLFDVAVRQVTATEYALYVSFGPGVNASQEPRAGLLVLKLRPGPPGFAILERTAMLYPYMTGGIVDSLSARVTYDDSLKLVYVCLVCNGLAIYDAGPGKEFAPVLLTNGYKSIASPFQAVRGPLVSGTHQLYVSLINAGIAVFDDVMNVATTPVAIYRTPFQIFSLGLDPTDAAMKRMYVTSGKGGLHRLVFP